MFYSVSNYMSSTNRMTGLASGLDIDSLVTGLTANTQAKITSKLQEKQLLNWKTEAYRSISSKMVSFSNKYFSYSSSTNLLSPSFFKSSTASTIGDYKDLIKVSGNSSVANKVALNKISSVASNAILTGKNTTVSQSVSMSAADLSDKTSNNLADKTIKIETNDGKSIDIKFDKNFIETDPQKIADYINAELKDKGIDTKIALTVEEKDGEQTFKLSNKGNKVSISGDALSVLGLKSGEVGAGNSLSSSKISGLELTSDHSLSSKKMSITLAGSTKEITLKEGGYTDASEFRQDLQSKFDEAFGKDKIKVELDGDKIKFTPSQSTSVLEIKNVDASITAITGIKSGDVNRVNLNKPIAELDLTQGLIGDENGKMAFTINGTYIEIDTTKETVSNLITKVNNSDANVTMSYSSASNRFTIESKETGEHSKVEIKDVTVKDADGNFSEMSTSNLATSLFGAQDEMSYKAGTDTKVTVNYNGETLEFSSSTTSINIDGMVIGLTDEAFTEAQKSGDVDLNIKFASTPDTKKIVETIQSFFDDYNEILELVNSEARTSKSASEKSYKPLTDEQKAEMTDKQVEEYEKIAKKGLLYGSSELNSLSSEMRASITNLLSNNTLASQIGISTSSNWSDNGKIVFDADSFEKALTEDPDKVIDMLTKGFDENYSKGSKEYTQSGGIMTRLKSTFDKYASNIGEKGILINIAGLDNSATSTNNSLARKIKAVDVQLDNLKKMLENETNRHYASFTRLETYISKMNTQSSWLYEQYSS